VTSSSIETYYGTLFDPIKPKFADIRISDIAHALAQQCRFSGHVRFHYSVAEHSIRVSEYLETLEYAQWVQLWGLLHDASEAYLIDLPSPIKESKTCKIGPMYKVIEARLMRAVCKRFSLPQECPEGVHYADAVLLATEARDLMNADAPHWKKLAELPLEERIRPWSAPVAEFEFLRRYRELTGDKR
jgi:hypothetical protein